MIFAKQNENVANQTGNAYISEVRTTIGYNALITALCNVPYVVFLRHTFITPADVGRDRSP